MTRIDRYVSPIMAVGVLESTEGDFNILLTFPKDVPAKIEELELTGELEKGGRV